MCVCTFKSHANERLPKNVPSSYRPIALTSCIGKMIESVLCARVTTRAELENWLEEAQNGFRKSRRAEDHMFALRELLDIRQTQYILCVP